jgi:hypothetical protein
MYLRAWNSRAFTVPIGLPVITAASCWASFTTSASRPIVAIQTSAPRRPSSGFRVISPRYLTVVVFCLSASSLAQQVPAPDSLHIIDNPGGGQVVFGTIGNQHTPESPVMLKKLNDAWHLSSNPAANSSGAVAGSKRGVTADLTNRRYNCDRVLVQLTSRLLESRRVGSLSPDVVRTQE